MKMIIGMILCATVGVCSAMEKRPEDKDKDKKESSPSRLAFIAKIINRASSPSALPSSPSSPLSSPSSSSPKPLAARDDQPTSKSHSFSSSPTGSRISKTIGRRGSGDYTAHLKDELAREKSTDFAITLSELKARLEASRHEQNQDKKKKDLEQLACAKEKKEENGLPYDFSILKKQAADEAFAMRANEIALALKNRLTYIDQNNITGRQQAETLAWPVRKLYSQQKALLLRFFESQEESPGYEQNQYITDLRMTPVLLQIEVHMQKNPHGDFKKLEEYQEEIKEEQFVPQ